jgi:hypothetical protein
MHIFHSYNVQTMYIHELAGICIYVDVHTSCTYMACTISLCHEQEIQKEKILQRVGLEPTMGCITASSLNHYTSSMHAR